MVKNAASSENLTSTVQSQQYFDLLSQYRDDYANLILLPNLDTLHDNITIGDKLKNDPEEIKPNSKESVEQSIQNLNNTLYANLLALHQKNTAQHLYDVIQGLDTEKLEQEADDDLICDPLYNFLMNKPIHIIPALQIKHLLHVKDIVDVLILKI